MKHIKNFSIDISEEVTNQNSETALRIVSVKYNGKPMNAVAIGYGSGPYYMEKYYILEDIPYDSSDFESIEEINPTDILKSI